MNANYPIEAMEEAPSSPRSAAIYYWGGNWDDDDNTSGTPTTVDTPCSSFSCSHRRVKEGFHNGFYWEEVSHGHGHGSGSGSSCAASRPADRRKENHVDSWDCWDDAEKEKVKYFVTTVAGSSSGSGNGDDDINYFNGGVIWDTTETTTRRRRRHVVRIQQRFHLAIRDDDDDTHWLVCPHPKPVEHVKTAVDAPPVLPSLDGNTDDGMEAKEDKEVVDKEDAKNEEMKDPSIIFTKHGEEGITKNDPFEVSETKDDFASPDEESNHTRNHTKGQDPSKNAHNNAHAHDDAEKATDSTFSSEFTSIPIVDLSLPPREYAIRIGKACRNVGFFYVINHGVDEELVEGVMDYSKKFFELGLEEKMKLMGSSDDDGDDGGEDGDRKGKEEGKGKGYRGYFGLGMEDLEGKDGTRDLLAEESGNDTGDNEAKKTMKGDFKEGFDCGIEKIIHGDDEEVKDDNEDECLRFFGKNQWPDEIANSSVSGFRKMMLKYQRELLALADKLLIAFAVSLDGDSSGAGGVVPEDYFITRSRNPMCTLRLLHYPPNNNDRNNSKNSSGEASESSSSGCGAHTDYGLFTILLQQNQKYEIGGLQVRNRAHKWIDAPPLKGSFVINVGDMLSWWTGGEYSSTVHRVISPSRSHSFIEPLVGNGVGDAEESSVGRYSGHDHRYSVPFFFNPDYDAVVKPIKRCGICNDGNEEGEKAEYKTAIEILKERYEGTFQKSK